MLKHWTSSFFLFFKFNTYASRFRLSYVTQTCKHSLIRLYYPFLLFSVFWGFFFLNTNHFKFSSPISWTHALHPHLSFRTPWRVGCLWRTADPCDRRGCNQPRQTTHLRASRKEALFGFPLFLRLVLHNFTVTIKFAYST